MVSAAVRTAGPARSGFIRADQPETDSAPATWPPGPCTGLATQAGPGFLGVVGEAGLADPRLRPQADVPAVRDFMAEVQEGLPAAAGHVARR
jgi:hypothetical protein